MLGTTIRCSATALCAGALRRSSVRWLTSGPSESLLTSNLDRQQILIGQAATFDPLEQ